MENITSQLSIKHDVTVITEQYDKNLKLLEIYRGIKIIRIPTYFSTEKQKKWVIWHWLYKNIDILRNSDIIHVNDVFFWILPWRLIKHFNQTFITFYGWETKFPIPYKNIMIRKISWVGALLSQEMDHYPELFRKTPNFWVLSPNQKNILHMHAMFLQQVIWEF